MNRLYYYSKVLIFAAIIFGVKINAFAQTTIFNYTGSQQSWTVPLGVWSVNIDAQGASGGLNSDLSGIYVDSPGHGARVQATLAVTPGRVLNVFVGGQGGMALPAVGGAAGYNGGGNGNTNGSFGAGAGGGASDIRVGGIAATNRLIVAGGGGGAGLDCGAFFDNGGDGGGLTGADGVDNCTGGAANGGGGSQTGNGVGGICSGCPGSNGNAGVNEVGGDGGASSAGAGGGGGFFGGGGGQWEGGGGGSSYTDATLATAVTHTRGFNSGINGVLAITITNYSPYFVNGNSQPFAVCQDVASADITSLLSINDGDNGNVETWTVLSGPTNGSLSGFPFIDISNGGVLSESNVFSYMPNGGYSGLDSFTIEINDGTGDTGTTTVYVTVNATPVLTSSLTPPNTCNSTVFNYTAVSAPAGTYSWSRAAVSGISPATSSDVVASISETLTNSNTVPTPVVYVYTLTANSCVGTGSVVDTIIPTLSLTSTLSPLPICSGTVFNYPATVSLPGASLTWNRNPVVGILNAGVIGATNNNPLEVLIDTTTRPAHSVPVTYSYTVIYGLCTSTPQNVVVTVNPTPRLSSPLTDTVCDSTMRTDTLRSFTTGVVTFSWSRPTVAGITNPYASAVNDSVINDTLVNTFSFPVTVVYYDTLKDNGCADTEATTVVVKPRAVLTTTTTPSAICNGIVFKYDPTFNTGAGTTFSWSRATVAGITETASSGIDSIMETLHNTSTDPVVVTYVDTLTAYGCVNIEKVLETVNPTPKLSSTATPAAVCDSAIFNYTPTSATVGATFGWDRPYVLGIDMLAGSGSDNPNEQLINTTYVNVNVVYVYTVSAHTCTSVDTVTVTVHPTPTLSTPVTETICSGVPFAYTPVSHTPAPQVTYTWTRAAVTGITPATGSGTTNINETLIDGTTSSKTVVYTYVLTVDGNAACFHKENVTLTVNPTPGTPSITIHPPSSLCDGTHYMNFGDTAAAPAGTAYSWSAVNGTVWATGAGRQNSIISFNNPGNAWVILTTGISSTACKTTDTFAVTVSSSVADNPQVIYYNGQFMCLQNNVDNFQWGYDDATSLDSTLIPGEINQVYFNSTPDLIHKYYWLMTNHNGCLQKTYYNVPTGITNLNTDFAGIKVYPNPAKDVINIEVNAVINGNMEVEIMNLLGQRLDRTAVNDNKTTVNVSSLPSGCYLVNCYNEGVKVATAKFIKN
jgi:glycine rich protein/type IX secretion system substrate protein/Big-like domain-containing protein/PKD domain-containing protein